MNPQGIVREFPMVWSVVTLTHVLCANMHKTVQQIFEIMILKFLANFLNFAFGLSLWQSSIRAVGQQASLVMLYFMVQCGRLLRFAVLAW